MQFTETLVEGRLVKRYKRFLADVMLPGGEIITAHTANTGAMTGCCAPGSRVWLSRSDNPQRKYPYTWELVEVAPDTLCGINTQRSNTLVREAVESGQVSELAGYEAIRTEICYGRENSRIDLLLEGQKQTPSCYVEVKNVTLVEHGIAYFPDAISARGAKHLRELIEVVKSGQRAVIFFCVQRQDCHEVRPADNIDPVYGKTLCEAVTAGVEAIAYQASVSTGSIQLQRRLPVIGSG